MDTLIREGNPPAGQLASPVPQVWDPTANGGAGGWVRVYGAHNSPRAILYGPNGQPISTANRLPVDATVSGTVDVSDRADRQLGKVTLSGSNVEILAEYQGYTGHNTQAGSVRYFGATVGMSRNFAPLDVRRFGGLVLKLTNGYNVAVTHRVVAFKAGEPGSPIWVDVTEDADLPAGAEFIYEIPNRYPYIALRVYAPARDQTGETGLDVDIVGSVFYA